MSIDEKYYLSSSSTELKDGSWKSSYSEITWVDGWYIWTKSFITYANGNTSETDPICVTGGKGVGVSSVIPQYYQSTSKTKLENGTWIDYIPTLSSTTYIWTRLKVIYTDGNVKTSDEIYDSTFDVIIDNTDKNTDEKLKSFYTSSVVDNKIETTTSGIELYVTNNYVAKTDDEENRGIDKWILNYYPRSSTTLLSTDSPKIEILDVSETPKRIIEFDDTSFSTNIGLGTYYIGHARTNIYCSANVNVTNTLSIIGKGSLYVNGVYVDETTLTSTSKSVSFTDRKSTSLNSSHIQKNRMPSSA